MQNQTYHLLRSVQTSVDFHREEYRFAGTDIIGLATV